MFYKSLEIEKFRGIEKLKIENIKQINLITGKNNCGKSSIIEALFLLTGMSNPKIPLNIHAFRGLMLTENEDFSYLFNNLDFSNSPVLKGKVGSLERSLKIKPRYSISTERKQNKIEINTIESGASTTIGDNINGLDLEFSLAKNKYQAEINIEPAIDMRPVEINLKAQKNYKETLVGRFINQNNIKENISALLNDIIVRKELKVIIDALKQIEPGITDIKLGAKNLVYADILNIDKLLPINIMGDGIQRLMSILVAISFKKNSIIFIDEIENGLHHEALAILWKAVFSAALDNNVQLFITTHSYECIQAFNKTFQDCKNERNKKDWVSLYRIEKTNESKHIAYQFDENNLSVAIENELEVR